jgi:Uma2 family endonuclease
VPRADVTFIRAGRLPNGFPAAGELTTPPDLAVEVVSPGDRAEYVEGKVREYLAAGVRLVWVIYPELGLARVVDENGGEVTLTRAETLSGGDVLPGFEARLADLIPIFPG